MTGYIVSCNLSKEINTKSVTYYSSCQLNHSSAEHDRYISRIAGSSMDNRPSVVANSKSATVRFIIRYCLVPRRLSFDENVRAKEGGKEACSLYPSHGPLRFITSHSFRARLFHAKNEAPEEEAALGTYCPCVISG